MSYIFYLEIAILTPRVFAKNMVDATSAQIGFAIENMFAFRSVDMLRLSVKPGVRNQGME